MSENLDQFDEDSSEWKLSSEGTEEIRKLIKLIKNLIPYAKSSYALIGLGEAWEALEMLPEHTPKVIVSIGIGFQEGDKEFFEKVYKYMDISDSEIRLHEISTSYSSDVGSNHIGKIFAIYKGEDSFSNDFSQWLYETTNLIEVEEAVLHVSRDHV